MKEQNEVAAVQHVETLNSMTPKDLQDIEKEHLNISYSSRNELIKGLREMYDDRFIRR